MIAGDAEGCARRRHVVDESNRVEDPWAAINEVADENRSPTQRMPIDRPTDERRSTRREGRGLVTQPAQQGFPLIAAAVDIADDVERPVFMALVAVERHALDRGGCHFLRTLQDEGVPEALPAKAAQGAAQLG